MNSVRCPMLVLITLTAWQCLVVNATPEELLIKGGTVVNHDQAFEADVHIKNGRIQSVGPDLKVSGKGVKVIDARGKYVMPGGIDPHTHLEMPFMGQVTCDDFHSGQLAALAGGTTMHIDFVLPVKHDLMAGLEAWRKKAARAVMDYSFHMAVTGWSEKVSRDMETLTLHHGISSFKFFMAYKGALMVTDAELILGMRRCKELGALVLVHAENGDAVADGQQHVFDSGITGPEGHPLSRPAILEAEATARAIRLAAWVRTPLYVVHVMSEDAMLEIAAARSKGYSVIGEVLSSGLTLDDSHVWDEDFVTAASFVMSPPLRNAEHRRALQRALVGRTLQLVGTDHAVFNSTQKAVGQHDFRVIPNGVNGIEERMHVVWQEMVVAGRMSVSEYVRVTSTEAARTFNLYPQKGLVAPGSDADVIILDPEVEHVISAKSHHSAIDTNVYEGYTVKGKVVTTISQGRLVWHEGTLHAAPGSGRFIPRATHGPLFEGVAVRDAAWMSEQFPYGPTPVSRLPVHVVQLADGTVKVEPLITEGQTAGRKDEL